MHIVHIAWAADTGENVRPCLKDTVSPDIELVVFTLLLCMSCGILETILFIYCSYENTY
jgi:hypothetical protein